MVMLLFVSSALRIRIELKGLKKVTPLLVPCRLLMALWHRISQTICDIRRSYKAVKCAKKAKRKDLQAGRGPLLFDELSHNSY
jgi:hypothetical protein